MRRGICCGPDGFCAADFHYSLCGAGMQDAPALPGRKVPFLSILFPNVTVCSQNMQQKDTFVRHNNCEVIAWQPS
jgi:hypothetical protein